jgi:hypothetical protein
MGVARELAVSRLLAAWTARVAKRAVSTVMRCLSVVRVLNRVS